jgi:hypothetical protein
MANRHETGDGAMRKPQREWLLAEPSTPLLTVVPPSLRLHPQPRDCRAMLGANVVMLMRAPRSD